MTGIRYNQIIIYCISLLISFRLAHAEQDDIDTTINVSDDVLEDYIIHTFCVIFALCLSFVGVLVAYISNMEDALMRKYKKDGEIVRANVVSADFVRVATPDKVNCACSYLENIEEDDNSTDICEYAVFVDYKRVESHCHTHVRKQVKALGRDFWKPSGRNNIKIGVDYGDADYNDNFESLETHRFLDLLVIPGYPMSGLPAAQIERCRSFSFLLPTRILVICLLSFSTFCLYVGIITAPFIGRMQWSPLIVTGIASASLFGAITLFVTISLGSVFRCSMEEQYLQGGEMVQSQGDDTTLSSGDDSYLLLESPRGRNHPPVVITSNSTISTL